MAQYFGSPPKQTFWFLGEPVGFWLFQDMPIVFFWVPLLGAFIPTFFKEQVLLGKTWIPNGGRNHELSLGGQSLEELSLVQRAIFDWMICIIFHETNHFWHFSSFLGKKQCLLPGAYDLVDVAEVVFPYHKKGFLFFLLGKATKKGLLIGYLPFRLSLTLTGGIGPLLKGPNFWGFSGKSQD